MAESASLDRYRHAELTVETLAAAADRLLRRLNVRPDDGRIAEAVDERGIRYYQTLGVLDKPTRYDGRRAVYGYRHLLQLLAVKKLQQEGHPLQLIQRALAARTTEGLEEAIGGVIQHRDAGEFEGERPQRDGAGVPAEPPSARSRLVAVRVAPGVTLTVDPSVVGDPEAVIALVERALVNINDRH